MKARLSFSLFINTVADVYIIDEAISVGDLSFNGKITKKLKN